MPGSKGNDQKKKKKEKRNDVKWRCYGVFSSLEHFKWDYLMDLLTTLNKFWLLILEQNNVLTFFRVRKKTFIRRQTKVQPTLLLLHVIKVFNSLQHKFSVDTVITDLKQSKTFSILDFCGGSWLRLQRLPTILEPDQRYTKKKSFNYHHFYMLRCNSFMTEVSIT